MTYPKTVSLLAALLCATGFARLARATDAAKPEAAKPAAGVALTDESIRVMLEAMGFQPQRQGDCTYLIELSRGGWKIFVRVSLSPDKSTIWFTTCVAEVTEANAPAAALLNLLYWNNYYNNVRFAYFKQTHSLCLAMDLPNTNVTPALLRVQLDTFVSIIQGSQDVWDTSKWPKPESKADAKPTDAPAAPAFPGTPGEAKK